MHPPDSALWSASPPSSHAGPLTLLIVIALCGLGFIIVSPTGLFNSHSDLIAENLATQDVLHDSWTGRRAIPLWRSDQLSGGPALTNPQAMYTHPLFFLFAWNNPARIVGLVIWLQMLLAAVGAFYAAASLRLSTPARLMTAVATLFSFKTILAAYAGWLAMLPGLAAMPVLFAAVSFALARPSYRSALALGVAGAVSLHGGALQPSYYALLYAAMWCAWTIGQAARARDRPRASALIKTLAMGAAIAVGLSAYRLLPLVADLPLLTRPGADYQFFLGPIPYPAIALLTLFGPERFGTPLDGSFIEAWEYVIYLGAVPTVLAVVGAVAGHRETRVRLLLAGVALSLLFSLHSPLQHLAWRVVPGFGLFRLPARHLFFTAFFGFCLAGIGLEVVLSRLRTPRTRVVVATMLIALTAAEGTAWARRYLIAPTPIPFPVRAPYLTLLDKSVTARIAPLSTFTPDYGSAAPLGLQLISGFDSFNYSHYQTYMDVLREGRPHGTRAAVWTSLDRITRWDLLDALNVRYVVSPHPVDTAGQGFALLGEFQDQPLFHFYDGVVPGPVFVYRNDAYLRRAFLVSRVTTVADEEAMTREVQRANLRDEAVVVTPSVGAPSGSPEDRVDILESTGGALDMTAVTSGRRFLVISEVWHPGWRATIDGRVVPLLRADIALQGLWLDGGAHRVRLTFWPPGLTAGLLISAASAILIVVGAAAAASRRRTRSS
ncbi:MAG: YfhO family protein [Vicinamibacterales bacterium]